MTTGNQNFNLYVDPMGGPSLPVAPGQPQLGSELGLGMGMNIANQAPTFDQTSFGIMTDPPVSATHAMMPLAAHNGGFEGETNSFPVFPPAWLDQAWALQTPTAGGSQTQF
ncbi:hypothetical protein IFR05_014428 [Cadophora sp. M221]|nr:hypothetical protein IFR05_014428 [Cadophora sp. M221]